MNRKVLEFIHDRMVHVHGENVNVDYLHALRRVINATEERTIEGLLGRELSPEEFEFSYLWESDRPMTMRCVMEFTPDDFGWGAHPDYPAECSLVACFVEGDISELLNMKQIGIIEASALLKHKDMLQEAHDDRRIERYNDRQQEEN